MLRFRIYIDTSVIGGCFDDEFAKYSNLLFNNFILGKKIAVVSNLTLKELKQARENVRKKFKEIPKKYIEFVGLTEEAEELARGFNSVNLKEGYQLIEIRTPMEVVDED